LIRRDFVEIKGSRAEISTRRVPRPLTMRVWRGILRV
jgi:hypothetical protein